MENYRPQDLNMYVKFNVESDLLVANEPLLRLDQVCLGEAYPMESTLLSVRRVVWAAQPSPPVNKRCPPFLIDFGTSLATQG